MKLSAALRAVAPADEARALAQRPRSSSSESTTIGLEDLRAGGGIESTASSSARRHVACRPPPRKRRGEVRRRRRRVAHLALQLPREFLVCRLLRAPRRRRLLARRAAASARALKLAASRRLLLGVVRRAGRAKARARVDEAAATHIGTS